MCAEVSFHTDFARHSERPHFFFFFFFSRRSFVMILLLRVCTRRRSDTILCVAAVYYGRYYYIVGTRLLQVAAAGNIGIRAIRPIAAHPCPCEQVYNNIYVGVPTRLYGVVFGFFFFHLGEERKKRRRYTIRTTGA